MQWLLRDWQFFCIFTVVKKFQHVPAKKFPDVSFLFQFDQFTYYAAPCLDHKCWELIDLWLSVIITILHKIRQYKVDLWLVCVDSLKELKMKQKQKFQ